MTDNRVHTLHVGVDNAITISGVLAIDSITDREAVVSCDCGRVTVKGTSLALNKLDSDKGCCVINSDSISTIGYSSAKKMSLKSLFGA